MAFIGGWVQVYCSRACARLARPPLPDSRIGKACDVRYALCSCGRSYVARGSRSNCSRKCTYEQYKAKMRAEYVRVGARPAICVVCLVTYMVKGRSRLCDGCRLAHRRKQKRRSERRREIARRGNRVESYRVLDVFVRDGWRCHLCGRLTKASAKAPHPLSPTVDHLVPISAGGEDSPRNVATAHFICNAKRGAGGVAQLRLIA